MDITVLTPAYNRGGGIQRLYASLDKQYNKNFEWMIVDDGSTDDTAQVVKELQESSDFKIRYIYKRNGGKHTALHDSIRPMVSADIITENIKVCREKGNAVTVIPCTSVMLQTEDAMVSDKQIPRDNLKITQTPQTFFLNELIGVHKEAVKIDLLPSIASCALYIEMGHPVYLCNGSEKNIKITTSEDIEIFQSLLESKRPSWLKY